MGECASFSVVGLFDFGDGHGDWEVVGESVLIDRITLPPNGIGFGYTPGATMAGGLRICTVTGSTLIGASPVTMFCDVGSRCAVQPLYLD
jgi:hypothetical protein